MSFADMESADADARAARGATKAEALEGKRGRRRGREHEGQGSGRDAVSGGNSSFAAISWPFCTYDTSFGAAIKGTYMATAQAAITNLMAAFILPWKVVNAGLKEVTNIDSVRERREERTFGRRRDGRRRRRANEERPRRG
jgi:hypothetical protein